MGDPHWERAFHGQVYKPQDISSFILRKVAGDAANLMGEKIEDVVITCPAYFGVNEKEATKQAGILAGLNVLYVIPEPTAAALAYGIEQDQEQVILVYDLGGGTFDITLIEIKTGQITVICTGGDHQLGGKDWDDAIVSYLTQKFEESTGTPADALLDDQETYQELLNAAERCKKTLSSRQSVTEGVRFGGEKVKVDLTRETFDQITAPLLERTISLTEQELAKAREKGYTKIDKLLLVGGSTYMPQVIEYRQSEIPLRGPPVRSQPGSGQRGRALRLQVLPRRADQDPRRRADGASAGNDRRSAGRSRCGRKGPDRSGSGARLVAPRLEGGGREKDHERHFQELRSS